MDHATPRGQTTVPGRLEVDSISMTIGTEFQVSSTEPSLFSKVVVSRSRCPETRERRSLPVGTFYATRSSFLVTRYDVNIGLALWLTSRKRSFPANHNTSATPGLDFRSTRGPHTSPNHLNNPIRQAGGIPFATRASPWRPSDREQSKLYMT